MTMKLRRAIAAMGLLAASFAACADTYEFDTLTAFTWGAAVGEMTGLPRNSSTLITLSLATNADDNHCIPMLLTMMEKPGRYYLTLTTSSSAPPQLLQRCALALRN